jgi:transcriptional regulator with XRE-family HTH domain
VSGHFGELLRSWRHRRGLSQLALANRQNISQRHISFLESGRARPSAEMIERLAIALAVPRADRNAMFAAAGLPSPHRDIGRSASQRAALDAALRTVLDMHAPYPAVLMDRCWNVRLANTTAAALIRELTRAMKLPEPVNSMELCFAPFLRPFIANWETLARMLLARVRAELTQTDDEEIRGLLMRLERLPGVVELSRAEPEHDRAVSPLPLFPLEIRLGGQRASLFSVITAIGTLQDLMIDDLRLELYYPADASSRRWLEQLGREGVGRLLPQT